MKKRKKENVTYEPTVKKIVSYHAYALYLDMLTFNGDESWAERITAVS